MNLNLIKWICKNCNGINLKKTNDFIICEDCAYLTTRILNSFSSSDIKRVKLRRIYKSNKKNIYNKDGY